MRAIGIGLGLPFAGKAAGGGGAPADPTLALDLNFAAMAGTLDPRVTFTRGSTATYINASGLIASAGVNVARFDHAPATLSARGLLLEEQRANALQQSQNLAAAPWSNDLITPTANSATAPDGTTTATLLTANATIGDNAFTYQSTTAIADSAVYATSVFVKKSVGDWCYLRVQSGTTPRVYFNLTTGVKGTTEAGITSAGIEDAGSGWYRIWAVRTEGGAGAGEFLVLAPCDADASPAVTAGKAIYAWGAQIEQGAFASSYIPTTTVAVTRAADSAVATGANFSSWYNPSEGTYVIEVFPTVNRFEYIIGTDEAAGDNQIAVYQSASVAQVYISVAGAPQPGTALSYPINQLVKLALAFKVGDSALARNGTVNAFAPGALPSPMRLAICNYSSGAYPTAASWVARFRFYNVRKPNADLVTLTT